MPPHRPASNPPPPLAQASLEILLTLASGELHGYGIKKQVEDRTHGAVRLGAGTLYAALERLVRDGLIEEVAEREDREPAQSRWRFYGLTAAGKDALKTELARLESILRHARAHSLLPRGETP